MTLTQLLAALAIGGGILFLAVQNAGDRACVRGNFCSAEVWR